MIGPSDSTNDILEVSVRCILIALALLFAVSHKPVRLQDKQAKPSGHYLVQSAPVMHGLIVLDISNGMKPVEVSRLKLSDHFFSHWTGWDPKTHRIVVTGSEDRLYLVKLDEATGAIQMDNAFRDADGKPGFNFADREWPHGWKGSGALRGVVFSR